MGEVEIFDNSPLTLYDMEIYGVDMMVLMPSMVGTTNESQVKLCEKHPAKFRTFVSEQQLKIKVNTGEAKWTIEAALEEIETALKKWDKWVVGIGEFVPRDWNPKKVYTFRERLDEYRLTLDLARKYGKAICFHDFTWEYEWDPWKLLLRVAKEYPDVPIIVNHAGHSIGAYPRQDFYVRRAAEIAGYPLIREGNVFLEIGTLPAEYQRILVEDPNVGPTKLLWGSDYGHVPQYNLKTPDKDPKAFSSSIRKWMPVPPYQTDWWGWMSYEINKLKQWVGQDEINLILGGNAAKIYKLPVPYERMFLCGRPDIFGIGWEESIPYIPREQVIYPDGESGKS
jgi:predicted TIM-barrel fold metal-dependent hydrolase